jgi:hypothetical protein
VPAQEQEAAMPPAAGDPELLNHFSVLIYPFLHRLTAGRRDDGLEALAERWEPWWARLTDAEAAEALDGSGFFLPYVQGLLFPETACLRGEPPGPGYAHWVARVRRWAERGTGAFARRLPAGSVLRLTCRPDLRAALREFTVPRRRADGADRAGRLDWVDAVLYPSGVGFLLLRARLGGDSPRLGQLIELNAALRLVLPPTLSWDLPRLRFRHAVRDMSMRDLIDLLTSGLAEGRDGPGSGYADTEAGRAYGERCHVFSYACIHLSEAERAALPAGPFADGTDRLLYEYATSTGLGESVRNPVWVPAPEQAERVGRENRLAMWRCWRGMALKESCVFLGTEDLGFNRRALAHNAEHDYLPLYLYTLYQKYRLLKFADGLMREVAQAEGHLRGARALLRRFVAFRNRFWFSDVTRRPLGGDLYRLLQQALEAPRLYDMVTASVKEAKEYYEDRWDRRVRVVVTAAGLVGGLVGGQLAAICGAVPSNLAGSFPAWAALLLAVAAAASVGLVVYRKRRSRRRRPQAPAHSGQALRLHWPGEEHAGKRCA